MSKIIIKTKKVKASGLDLIKSAPFVKAKKPAKIGLKLRPGTAAFCEGFAGDPISGRLMHALFELWVDTPKKIKRPYEGDERDYLFLSAKELVLISGLTISQIYNRAVPKLKATNFFTIKKGRLTYGSPNCYQIYIDAAAFWLEVEYAFKPEKLVTKNVEGGTVKKSVVDPSQLPYLFRRLHDCVSAQT